MHRPEMNLQFSCDGNAELLRAHVLNMFLRSFSPHPSRHESVTEELQNHKVSPVSPEAAIPSPSVRPRRVQVDDATLKAAIRRATVGLKFVPVFMGSAYKNKVHPDFGLQPAFCGA